MRFKKFTIEGYKAIDNVEIPVGNNLIPLIGINESGKTTILQAILSFDKQSDKYGGGIHLDYDNIFMLDEHGCNISADVVIENESELDEISEKLKLTRGNDLLKELEECKSTSKSIRLIRDLKTKKYSVAGFNVPDKKKRALANAIYDLLPFILYFDDFTDRVPEEIIFTRSGGADYRIRNRKLGDWQNILEEIFKRATDRKQSLASFIDLGDRAKRDGLLSDISDELNKEVIGAWREMKQKATRLADDSAELELGLEYDTKGDTDFLFRFRVTDRANVKKRYFNVVERSKGFQWFFNFQMKLKFNPKYKKEETGAIYLLDEPGSYLHSSAQKDVLSALQEISKTNTILYCSHSQYLLDPEKINVNQTRIVEFQNAEKGKNDIIVQQARINITPFSSAQGPRTQGALTPLYDALRLKTGVFNRQMENVVLTEGIIDYYFLSMLREYTEGWQFNNFNIIPGSGAGNLKDLISMAIAWADNYLVLLDSDEAGTKAKGKYEKHFGNEEMKNFFNYITPSNNSDIKLEDFLSSQDKKQIKDVTECKDIKNAITTLFYSSSEKKEQIFSAIKKTTRDNLSRLQAILKSFNEK